MGEAQNTFSVKKDRHPHFNDKIDNEEGIEMDEVDSFPKGFANFRRSISKRFKAYRESADVGGCSLVRNAYKSAVDIPCTYREHKREEDVDCFTFRFLRKSAGIPLAFGYYLLLIWIISSFVLDKTEVVDHDFTPVVDTARNICDIIFSNQTQQNISRTHSMALHINLHLKNVKNLSRFREKSESLINTPPSPVWKLEVSDSSSTQRDNQTMEDQAGLVFENDFLELHIVIGSLMGLISLISIFSRNTRATMVLILPGLITNRSRHVIFTVALGILTKSHINNLRLNFIKLLENSICMYRAVIAMSCVKEKEGSFLLKYARDAREAVAGIYEQICKFPGMSGCKSGGIPPFPFHNSTFDDMKSITAPSTQGIKAQAAIVMDEVGQFGEYIEMARRGLTLLSIVLLIVDAIRYLRLFYIDSSFDNVYIDFGTRREWKKKNYYKDKVEINSHPFAAWNKEEGLRYWEKKQGFKMVTMLNIPRLSKMLLLKMFRITLSTFAFTFFVLLVVLADQFLAKALVTIKKSQKLHVALKGFTENITDSISANLQDYSTKSCLATPHYTSDSCAGCTTLIFFLLFLALLSCVLQVFMGGLRARLCSLFYPDRVEERADYLFFRIFNGRINRKRELMLIIALEATKREKLNRFSPLQRMIDTFKSRTILRMIRCPGCKHKVKKSTCKPLRLDAIWLESVGKNTVEDCKYICEDCQLDISSRYLSSDNVHSSLIG